MKRNIFVLILLILPFFGLTQETFLCGLILDVNNQPILNANIFNSKANKGINSDRHGRFCLRLNDMMKFIKISNIAYETKTIELEGVKFNSNNKDTIRLKIHLTPKVNQLTTLEISSNKIKLLYNKPFISILDYQFHKDNILLLLRDNGVEKIKLIDNNQEVIQELVVENDLKSLFQDCFGNVHVLNDDSAYQLKVDTENLYIEFKCSLKKFSTVLKPCVIEIDTLLLFKKFGLHNQSIAYFYYNKNNKRRYLKIIRNTSREKQASLEILANKDLENILEKGPPDAGLMGEYNFFDSIGRLLFQGNNMYNKILTKPLYSPLFKINTNLYIFDHPNNNCYTFGENLKLKTTIPIDYHLQKKWKKQLIVDKEQGAVYARFEKNGFCYLKKIDLTTGKIIESYKLEKHTFPTNIKIKNNTAYYLHKDHYNHGQMSLFKQGLY